MPVYWGTQKIGEIRTENHEHIWVDINNIYPIGAIYMSASSINPSTLFGGTWQEITGKFLLSRSDSYIAGSTGGESTVTLTNSEMPMHSHTIYAHNHGLNSHTHSIPALSGTAASNGAHTHGDPSGRKFMFTNGDVAINGTGRQGVSTGGDWYYVYGQTSSTGIWEGSVTSSNGAHTHSVTTTANSTGGPVNGNTANSSAAASSEEGNGAAHNNMPPYLVVYMWQRIA